MKKLLSIVDLAELLGLATVTVRRLHRRGRLPKGVRIGRQLRWRPEIVEAWLAKSCPPEKRPAKV